MLHFSVRRSLPVIGFSLLLTLFLSVAAPVHASGTVLDCDNDTAFSSLLVGGGTVTFNCGNANLAATIALSSTKTISANTTIDGGGKVTLSGGFGLRLFVVNNSVTLTLRNITLINGYNSSAAGGGAVLNNGHLILENVIIHTMPDSGFNGGAIATYGTADITDSEIYDSKATNGGAIFASGLGATVNLTNSKVHDNGATGITTGNGLGGAIYLVNGAHANLTNSQVYANKARQGGGIYVAANSVANVTTSLIDDNRTYAGNTSGRNGGGIYNKGNTTLNQSTVSRNEGYDYAGGINNDGGTLTATDSTITGNYVTTAGGGGIANGPGTMNLTNTTISGNFAGGTGGGISNGNDATATLTNVTISGNYAYSGGGMWNLFRSVATLTNVTFSGNTALSNGGALGNSNDADTHLYLTNVIFANSKTSSNCNFQKAPDTSDHNLSSDASCNFGAGRDNAKLKLGPLETNGGWTLTHRLMPGSPAIDNGVFVNSILTDQRGINFTRPKGAAFDVGAFEFVPCDTPSKPERLAPLKGAQLTTQQVTLDWIGPDCAKTFSVVVRQGSKTGPLAFSKGNIKATQVTTTALAKNQKYFWQVTACKGTQCTTGSWGKFTVK